MPSWSWHMAAILRSATLHIDAVKAVVWDSVSHALRCSKKGLPLGGAFRLFAVAHDGDARDSGPAGYIARGFDFDARGIREEAHQMVEGLPQCLHFTSR